MHPIYLKAFNIAVGYRALIRANQPLIIHPTGDHIPINIFSTERTTPFILHKPELRYVHTALPTYLYRTNYARGL